jgi:dimethylargininase
MTSDHAPDPLDGVLVRSETGRLQRVAMRRAARGRAVRATALASFASASGLQQLRHNRFGEVRPEAVVEQQEAFADVMRAHGVTVDFLPDTDVGAAQHYTRDVGFVVDDLFVVARMGKAYRRPETAGLSALLARLPRVVRLDAGTIEGGDVMLHGDVVMVGLGDETTPAAVESLRRALYEAGNGRRVVQLDFAQPGIIHLDTKVNVVGGDVALISPSAFTPQSLRWLENRFDLVVATAEETRDVQINTLSLGDGRVVMSTTAQRLAGLVADRGLTPVLVDYSEVTRVPGSFRCTTLPLVRAES